jgi:hypothetical protein
MPNAKYSGVAQFGRGTGLPTLTVRVRAPSFSGVADFGDPHGGLLSLKAPERSTSEKPFVIFPIKDGALSP